MKLTIFVKLQALVFSQGIDFVLPLSQEQQQQIQEQQEQQEEQEHEQEEPSTIRRKCTRSLKFGT